MYLIIGALLELVLSEDIVICGESNSARSELGCVELVKLVTFIFSYECESLLLRNWGGDKFGAVSAVLHPDGAGDDSAETAGSCARLGALQHVGGFAVDAVLQAIEFHAARARLAPAFYAESFSHHVGPDGDVYCE